MSCLYISCQQQVCFVCAAPTELGNLPNFTRLLAQFMTTSKALGSWSIDSTPLISGITGSVAKIIVSRAC
jgi:hypothetical protein